MQLPNPTEFCKAGFMVPFTLLKDVGDSTAYLNKYYLIDQIECIYSFYYRPNYAKEST